MSKKPNAYDINDLIELQELEKGGPGSGQRGHETSRMARRLSSSGDSQVSVAASVKHGNAIKEGKQRAGANRFESESVKRLSQARAEARKKLNKSVDYEDINDLVEQEMSKGGVGSGIKGHLTIKDYTIHERMKVAAKHGRLDKLRGAHQHFQNQYVSAKKEGRTEHAEHYKKLRNESMSHLANRLGKSLEDFDLDSGLEKGGQGSGVRGHRGQPMPGSGALLERIRAARHRYKHESDPKKKEQHRKELHSHFEAYDRLNPHLKD